MCRSPRQSTLLPKRMRLLLPKRQRHLTSQLIKPVGILIKRLRTPLIFHGYTLQGYGELDADTDLGLFGSAIGLGFRDAGNLDNFQIDPQNNKLNVTGWFASYDSRGRDQYHYIIFVRSKQP